MEPIRRCVAGIDVHRMVHVVTVLNETGDGQVDKQTRTFGGFKRDLRMLTSWLAECHVELVIMESTGIYWKSVYAHLEAAAISAWVVNARHVKHVPGRKTDVADAEWLAQLGRFGLVRGSFIPCQDLRELRLLSHYRCKLVGQLASEKNRLHKVLDDGGIKLGGVVSDINGVSARAMIQGLIAEQSADQLATLGRGALRHKQEALAASMDGGLSLRHRFVLNQLEAHIQFLEAQIAQLDSALIEAMVPYKQAWQLLQTIPGIDAINAVMILVEIGDDPHHFGNAHRLASWAGLCPGNNESAGKHRTGRIRPGNRTLRYLLCEAANAARHTTSVFKSKYEGLVVRRGHKRTIIAIAHKILRTVFVLLTRHQPYRDTGIDYEAMSVARNAPRWIKALKKFGYWPAPAEIPA